MQQLRGTKDILPKEIEIWQQIYSVAIQIFNIANYQEIRTPILENTDLFLRTIGNETDIINKEMYTFIDKGKRSITLRPEGTASIARAFITNKLYTKSNIQKLWYLGPMFRYERPQKGRQRQFHQLGVEYIGSSHYLADVDVIRLAVRLLESIELKQYHLEINSIGNLEERTKYEKQLFKYLEHYKNDLDEESKNKLRHNVLRILDSKDAKTQEILLEAPTLQSCLETMSLQHFNKICEHLTYLNIAYKINTKLVRGLDYYNNTAFEIKTDVIGNQSSICGGGRYDTLIEQIGGPKTPAVGWAIGIERLILSIENNLKIRLQKVGAYIIIQGEEAEQHIWSIIKICEKYSLKFEIEFNSHNLSKQIKKANQNNAKICFIIGINEVKDNYCTVKWLNNGNQHMVNFHQLDEYIYNHRNSIIN